VIFFGDNIVSRAQIWAVTAELEQAAAQSPVKAPLLLMTDQEGGQVRRLSGAPTLSEKRIGASADPASVARQAGRGAGLNLKGVGMNVNLAPVLDVFRTRGNFIDQFGRSYSSSPSTVARLGGDFIRAQQATGVAATAKHFPGLGAATTLQNSDLRPVTLRLSLNALRTVDELPYSSAIASGARLVMVSWATYPALDPRVPAGLSRAVIQGELRKRMRFTGVTITDALEAGALRAFGSVSSRAVAAAGAGMDLLLCSARSVQQGAGAVSALAAARRTGRLNPAAFDAAAQRVIALRSALAG
jgi:beta-N-acetylhexosaminidase